MSLSEFYKVVDLYEAGGEAYGNGQHRSAAELYRQAMELAEVSATVPNWYAVVMRRAFADELVSMERLREALAALAPISKRDEENIKSCCVYGNLTDHVEIGLKLPVSLRTIERAYAQAESYFKGAGDASWRSRLLHYKGQLYFLRGLHAEALATAQEGWAIWKKDCPKLFATTQLQGLFEVSLAVGDARLALGYLEKWKHYERIEDKKYRIREAALNVMLSRLARLEGCAGEALDAARRALQHVEMADWGTLRYAASTAFVRACLVAGEHVRGRDVLARLSVMRRSQSGHDRYALQLLRGDYHLARARLAAGLAPSDDEYAPASESLLTKRSALSPRFELGKARAAYAAALEIGRWIDRQLECTKRQDEIAARLSRAKSVEKAAAVERAAAIERATADAV